MYIYIYTIESVCIGREEGREDRNTVGWIEFDRALCLCARWHVVPVGRWWCIIGFHADDLLQSSRIRECVYTYIAQFTFDTSAVLTGCARCACDIRLRRRWFSLKGYSRVNCVQENESSKSNRTVCYEFVWIFGNLSLDGSIRAPCGYIFWRGKSTRKGKVARYLFIFWGY